MKRENCADRLVREFLLGFIKIHILHHAARESVYGAEFQNELARHGYRLSFGTIYPVFHRLESGGYLRSERVKVGGKARKYYAITQKGRKSLAYSRSKVRELFTELSGQPPRRALCARQRR